MPPYSSYDERELFLRTANGDEQAFTEIFHLYTPKLLPFILKIAKNEHLAEEMVQETFLRLWMNRTKLLEVNEPSSWIFGIASNVTVTYLKTQLNRKKLLQKIKVAEGEDSLSEKINSKELDLIIQRAISLLPERRQELYRLSREQGLTHQQIAEKLKLSSNTVKNQIGISLRFIQEYINKETGLSIVALVILFGR